MLHAADALNNNCLLLQVQLRLLRMDRRTDRKLGASPRSMWQQRAAPSGELLQGQSGGNEGRGVVNRLSAEEAVTAPQL